MTAKLDRRRFLGHAALLATGAPFALALNQAAGASGSDVVVETTAGRVRGKSADGINQFLGVPYGALTDGANRFMPPVKPQEWSGVRDSFEFGPIAPQRNPGLPARPIASRLSGWD